MSFPAYRLFGLRFLLIVGGINADTRRQFFYVLQILSELKYPAEFVDKQGFEQALHAVGFRNWQPIIRNLSFQGGFRDRETDITFDA